MKALFTLLFSVIISLIFITTCNSQDRFMRGSYAVGGGIGMAKEDYRGEYYSHSQWYVKIKPNISYFIFNYISSDLYIGFGYADEETEEWGWEIIKNRIETSNIGIGLGLSFYLPLENTYPFFKSSISYGHSFNKEVRADEKIFGASVGIAIFLSNSVALEPELGYDYGLWSNSSYTKNIYWMSFGIKYYVYEFGLE